MNTKTMVVGIVVLFALSVAVAQPPKGGQRGGGMRGGGIDQEWAALCFEINISADQVAKLRPTFQWAWKARNAAIQKAMVSKDMASVRTTMETTTKTINERVNLVLTATQKAQWAKYKANQAAMRDKWRKAAGGAGRSR